MTRRSPTPILAGAVVLMLAGSRVALAGGSPAEAENQAPPQTVFSPPSDEELKGLTHPALRLELLRMAAEDQHARLSGS